MKIIGCVLAKGGKSSLIKGVAPKTYNNIKPFDTKKALAIIEKLAAEHRESLEAFKPKKTWLA